MGTPLDDYELVNLIEGYPILYDKDRARGIKNASRKDDAWKAISEKLGASERACITRWKSIRDRFGKELRRYQEHPNDRIGWDMFPRLLFLKDHYKHGQAKHESLAGIKFEPKERRRRGHLPCNERDKMLEEEDDMSAEENEINLQLIELVKMHPVLYDRQKIRESKNLTAKYEAWRTISLHLNIEPDLCFSRWKKLRDRFAREYRNYHIDKTTAITWRYFNDLMFLARHYRKGVPLIVANAKKRGRPLKNPANEVCSAPPTEVSGSVGEQIWGSDYPYSTDNEELDQEDDAEIIYKTEEECVFATDVVQGTRFVPLDDYIQQELSKQMSQQSPEDASEPAQSQHLVVDNALSLDQQQVLSDTLFHADGLEAANAQLTSDVVCSPLASGAVESMDTPVEKLIGNVIVNMETVLQQSKECLQALQEQNAKQRQELESSTAPSSMLRKARLLLDGLSPEQRRCAERKIVHFLCECQIKTLDGQEIEDVASCQICNC